MLKLWCLLQVPPGTQVPVMFDISHLPQVWAAAQMPALLFTMAGSDKRADCRRVNDILPMCCHRSRI